jgi:hypothetical protein
MDLHSPKVEYDRLAAKVAREQGGPARVALLQQETVQKFFVVPGCAQSIVFFLQVGPATVHARVVGSWLLT